MCPGSAPPEDDQEALPALQVSSSCCLLPRASSPAPKTLTLLIWLHHILLPGRWSLRHQACLCIILAAKPAAGSCHSVRKLKEKLHHWARSTARVESPPSFILASLPTEGKTKSHVTLPQMPQLPQSFTLCIPQRSHLLWYSPHYIPNYLRLLFSTEWRFPIPQNQA